MIKTKVGLLNYQRGLVTAALIFIVAIIFVVGGIFIYAKYQTQSADDAMLRATEDLIKSGRAPQNASEMYALLAWEKTRLQIETAKLNEMRGLAIDAALGEIYDGVDGALSLTKFNTNNATGKKLEAIRAKIAAIQAEWKIIRGAGGASTRSAFEAAINKDLASVLAYIDELKQIINTLTPANSGLTQEEIDAYKKAVDDSAISIDTATNILIAVETGVQPTTGGGSSGTATNVIPVAIVNQTNVVTEITNNINNLQTQIDNLPPSAQATPTVTPTSSKYGDADYGYYYINGPSSMGGIIYPPNPAPIRRIRNTDGPQMVEGANDL